MDNHADAVPPSEAASPKGPTPQSDWKLEVHVAYVGAKDFEAEFPGGETVKAVKLAAMKFFLLEPSSQQKYVLMVDGVIVDEKIHVRDLGEARVRLRLSLREEPVKG